VDLLSHARALLGLRLMDLALFDFDGTVTHVDSFVPFVRHSVPSLRFVVGAAALTPWIIGYRLGRVSGPRMRAAIVRIGFTGRAQHRVERHGAEYAATLDGYVRSAARRRIEWHRGRGDEVVIVSASLDVYLKHWCKGVGVALISSRLEARNGVLTGRYLHGDCTGEEKVRRICRRYDLTRYDRIHAYGDTDEDRAMLELADERFLNWRRV